MEGILLFGCVVAGFIWLMMYLRKREVAAFRDTDVSLLNNWKSQQQLEAEQVDPIKVKAEAYLNRQSPVRLVSDTTKSPTPPDASTHGGPVAAPHRRKANGSKSDGESSIRSKSTVLASHHRSLLKTMETVLGAEYCVFSHLPLTEFLEGPFEGPLSIAFLICNRQYLSPVAGVDFSDPTAGQSLEQLKRIFADIDKPLIMFPLSREIDPETVHRKLSVIAREQPRCPRCGRNMQVKQRAGRKFFLCDSYPGCRGVVRIQS